jgi:penicillin-binding protein 1A
MEVETGDMLALVGGRDFRISRFNRATLGKRQAGSAFKPFVYGAAIAEGYPPSQPILDAPVTLASNGKQWQPRNYDDEYYGMLSMRTALAYSRNIPSVRLAAAVGHDRIQEMARNAGIRGTVQNTPMVALGITEVTPLELTNAIATIAAHGQHAEPRFVISVEDEYGKEIYRHDVKTEQRIDPAVAYLVTDMMRDVIEYGTGTAVRAAGFNGPVAGKSGTTSDGADVWFVGFTPDVAAGVWIGYDERRALPGRSSGGSISAPVFGRMMRRIYKVRPMPSGFVVPDGIVARLVDPESGMVLENGCFPRYGNPTREVFLRDYVPDSICPYHEPENIFEAIGGLLGKVFGGDDEPPEPEPEVRADGSRDILGAGKITKRPQQ